MRQYLNLLQHILDNGALKPNRTGIDTLSVMGHQMRFDISDQKFPLLTTKRLHLRSIIYELLWFLKGDTNIAYLQENGVHIWDEWADERGDLGPIYGKQWRSWNDGSGNGIDQILQTIQTLKTNPNSRRMIVNAWNVGTLEDMALMPCHCLFQFYVDEEGLSCQLYQRSADVFLGLPFNIASYALLTQMIAQVCGLKAKEFIWLGGDTHLYVNHIEQAKLQLTRSPLPLPTMKIDPSVQTIDDFKYEHFCLTDYKAHPHIPGTVAV